MSDDIEESKMNLDPSLKILLLTRAFSGIGYFSLVFLLAILLLEAPFSYKSSQISILVGCLAMTDRGVSFFWSVFMQKIGYKKSLLLGTFLPLLGLTGIILFQNFVWCLMMLLLVGTGLSLESLASRLWISSIPDRQMQLKGFSLAHRAINVGAFIASGSLVLFSYFKNVFFFLGGIAFFFAVSTLMLFFYFREEEDCVTITKTNAFSFFAFRSIFSNKTIWIYFLTFFLGVYFMCQINLLPFYFKKFGGIPSLLGWMFALNPLLIIFFQGKISRLFSFFQNKRDGLGILMGFILMGVAFLILTVFESIHRVWLTMIFMSFGEMFIIPHMDYLIGRQLSFSLRPIFFAFGSILFAAGRTLSEGAGIMGIDWFYRNHFSAQWWWFMDSLILMAVVVSAFFIIMRASDFGIRKTILETETL